MTSQRTQPAGPLQCVHETVLVYVAVAITPMPVGIAPAPAPASITIAAIPRAASPIRASPVPPTALTVVALSQAPAVAQDEERPRYSTMDRAALIFILMTKQSVEDVPQLDVSRESPDPLDAPNPPDAQDSGG